MRSDIGKPIKIVKKSISIVDEKKLDKVEVNICLFTLSLIR